MFEMLTPGKTRDILRVAQGFVAGAGAVAIAFLVTTQLFVKAPAQNSSAAESLQFPATSRQQALNDAQKSAGRTDPLAPLQGFKPFPSSATATEVKDNTKTSGSAQKFPTLPTDANGKVLIPPPPPVSVNDEFPVSELPLPPDRPSLAAKMKLTGIMGDTAVFAFTDKETARQNRWPPVLMLNAGDRFETVEIISVQADSAVLMEDGTRSVKTLERIR
jgi:hypothetical protein